VPRAGGPCREYGPDMAPDRDVAAASTRRVEGGLASLVAAAALTGCASLAPDATAAADVALAFHSAVSSGDGTAACGLLAPAATEELEHSAGSPCPDAVLAADLTPGADVLRTHAWGRQAQVVMADDVVFLTVSGGDWLVTAAGCTPRPERPYDCRVSGG
jgi:hypothetical protein